jgi:hypothetical protein
MKTRGVRQSTLQKRLAYWKPKLKLSDWDINIRYATKKEAEKQQRKEKGDLLAFAHDCDPAAKRATILIVRDYHKGAGHKTAWNVDTLILHELIHIVVWSASDAIPESIANHSKVHEFEEYVCDSLADIIYSLLYNRL